MQSQIRLLQVLAGCKNQASLPLGVIAVGIIQCVAVSSVQCENRDACGKQKVLQKCSAMINFRRRSRKLRFYHHALSLSYHCLSADVRNLFLKAPLSRLFYSLLFTLDVMTCSPAASVQDPNVQEVDIFFLQVQVSKSLIWQFENKACSTIILISGTSTLTEMTLDPW